MNHHLRTKIAGSASAALMLAQPAVCAAEVIATPLPADAASCEAAEKIANVQGVFSFDQDTVSPPDRTFNLFGTAITAMCARPAFAFDAQKADYYVNVGGKVEKSMQIDLRQQTARRRTLLCACATGPASANVEVVGVSLRDILELANMDEAANTVSVKGSDGYTSTLPLSYALDHEAMIVYSMNGENMIHGTQFWVPGTVAKYFTRDVVSIEVLQEPELPSVEGRDESLRAEIALLNQIEGDIPLGREMVFEGYADDLGEPIACVEFSMDGGQSWTSCPTDGTVSERWVHWQFAYTPEKAGTYQLLARARTETGRVSKLAAEVNFRVSETES